MQVEGQSVWNRTAPISRDKWHHITWQLYYFGWRKTRPAPTCSACGRGLRWHVCSWCRWCCMVWIINVFHVMWFKAVVLCEDESCFENAAKINSPRAVLLLKHHDPKLCVLFFFTLWSIQTPRNRALRHVEDTRAVEARTRKQYYRKRVTSRFNKQGFYFFAYGQEEEHTRPVLRQFILTTTSAVVYTSMNIHVKIFLSGLDGSRGQACYSKNCLLSLDLIYSAQH